jgi:hypothetical protein
MAFGSALAPEGTRVVMEEGSQGGGGREGGREVGREEGEGGGGGRHGDFSHVFSQGAKY